MVSNKGFSQNSYIPASGDKFQYKISQKGGKYNVGSFVFDKNDKLASFYFKIGNDNPKIGTWIESKIKNNVILTDITDTLLEQGDLVFINSNLFKQIKSGKNFKLIIQKKEIEFKCGNSLNYNLPLNNASIDFKVISASSIDGRWILNILDNSSFPLITSLLGDISWQLQSIVPVPMYPITDNIVGKRLDDAKASMFRTYFKETSIVVEVTYTENFKKVIFNEYFCPTIGIRFSLKNDTIISLQLLSERNKSDGYDWKTYRGYVWETFVIGDDKKAIEKKLGKPLSNTGSRYYYPQGRFYLLYDKEGKLELVEYE